MTPEGRPAPAAASLEPGDEIVVAVAHVATEAYVWQVPGASGLAHPRLGNVQHLGDLRGIEETVRVARRRCACHVEKHI